MDLTSSDLHPLTLKAVLDARDHEWVGMEPRTLWELVSEVGPISNENRAKVQGIKTIMAQPETVVDDWRIFNNVLLSLNGSLHGVALIQ